MKKRIFEDIDAALNKGIFVKRPLWIVNRLNLDKTYEALLEYIELRLELLEIEVKERTVVILSAVAILMIIVSLGLFVLLFLSFGLAALLNDFFQSRYLGYFIMGALFAILCVIIVVAREKIIISKLIKVFFEHSLKDEENDSTDE